MPRRLTSDEIDYAQRLYASGQSFDEVARALGRKSSDGIRKALLRSGVVARPRNHAVVQMRRIDPPADLAERYGRGDSVLQIAAECEVSRNVVTRWLTEASLEVRSSSEASTLRLQRMTPAERSALTEAAHEAIRSSERTNAWQEAIAQGRERVQYGGRTSPGADRLCAHLDASCTPYLREKAVGRYNIDIALTDANIAVEVLGGNWHGSKAIHARRTPYILNAGWDLIFVWDVQACEIGPGALEYILSYAQLPSRNPSSGGEYRVIRGDGQLLATGKADDDEFPLIPPPKATLN